MFRFDEGAIEAVGRLMEAVDSDRPALGRPFGLIVLKPSAGAIIDRHAIMPDTEPISEQQLGGAEELELRVRRIHRRDLNRVWEFLKLVFRDVNRETVEYQRPRLKKHFWEIYEVEGIEQLLFEVKKGGKYELVGYAEFAYEITGSDNWMNHRYFEKRNMRPLFVEEFAVHPSYHGLGVSSFIFEQIEHAARLRGCTHIVLEVAENNERALKFYRTRSFFKLDAAIFMAKKVSVDEELLGPRKIRLPPPE